MSFLNNNEAATPSQTLLQPWYTSTADGALLQPVDRAVRLMSDAELV